MRITRRRTWILAVLSGTALIGALFFYLEKSSASPRAMAEELLIGASFADSAARISARGKGDSSLVLAELYLERARLGLGSPFRLVEYALRDPLLKASHRRLVANAILARTQQGRIYTTPAEALNLISPSGEDVGLAHRNLMERVIDESSDPRAAELALRLAYQIGTSTGVVAQRAQQVVIAALAQARDRALAMRDVEELLKGARAQRMDPVDLVPIWRASRRFAVEKPLTGPATRGQDRETARILEEVMVRLDSVQPGVLRTFRERSLGADASSLAVAIAESRNAPPQAPVVVTINGFSSYVMGGARNAVSRAVRGDFLEGSTTEETMAARYARLLAREGRSSETAMSVLSAALALRPYAQERTWLPGDRGPSPLDLQDRLGLASLTFDGSVPASWKPYYTRMLDDVVSDLRLVFPRFDLSGLHVRFGDSPLRKRALALHDPATRTVFLPIATSAGATAHEFAHDLDWQAARKRYGSTTGYRTDRSVRHYRDDLATTLARMASVPRGDKSSTSSDRPTETFARGADWIIASALAEKGILNGYLTAVQDEVITGYASATAPRRDATRPDATIRALTEIAEVDRDVVEWYESAYGYDRKVDLADAVTRALTVPMPRLEPGNTDAFDVWTSTASMLRSTEEAMRSWDCLLEAPSLEGSDRESVRRVMQVAASQRVKNALARWGEYATRGRGDERFRVLAGAPWNPEAADSLGRELESALLWRAARASDGRPGVDLVERADRNAAWEACAR